MREGPFSILNSGRARISFSVPGDIARSPGSIGLSPESLIRNGCLSLTTALSRLSFNVPVGATKTKSLRASQKLFANRSAVLGYFRFVVARHHYHGVVARLVGPGVAYPNPPHQECLVAGWRGLPPHKYFWRVRFAYSFFRPAAGSARESRLCRRVFPSRFQSWPASFPRLVVWFPWHPRGEPCGSR